MNVPRYRARPGEYVLILAAVTVTIGLTVMVYPSLPDPVASHWGFNGQPDDSLPRIVDATLIPFLVAACSILLWAAGRADRPSARLMVAVANGLAVFFVGLRYLTFVANANVAQWQDAGLLTAADMLGAFTVGVIAGAAGFVASQHRPDHVVQVRHVTNEAKANAPETFDAYVAARVMTVVPVIVAASGVLVWVTVPPPAGLLLAAVCGVITVLTALFTRARVHIDDMAVRVSLGPFGYPTVKRAVTEIHDVVVLDVEPLAYGGWGYRVVPGVRAVILRRGEGVRIVSPGRPDLIVTVDRADVAAAVISRHMS